MMSWYVDVPYFIMDVWIQILVGLVNANGPISYLSCWKSGFCFGIWDHILQIDSVNANEHSNIYRYNHPSFIPGREVGFTVANIPVIIIILADVFTVSFELTIVCFEWASCFLDFSFNLDALVKCLDELIKRVLSRGVIFFNWVFLHFLPRPALQRYLTLFDSVWNPSTNYGELSLRVFDQTLWAFFFISYLVMFHEII